MLKACLYRTMLRVAGATLLAVLFTLSTHTTPARAADCHYSGNPYSSGSAICLDGFVNNCQANGTWAIDRRSPCSNESTSTEEKSCLIHSNQSVAPGTQACIDGKLRECGRTGSWVELGKGNC